MKTSFLRYLFILSKFQISLKIKQYICIKIKSFSQGILTSLSIQKVTRCTLGTASLGILNDQECARLDNTKIDFEFCGVNSFSLFYESFKY